jgi:nicotinamidase/pyrazinamidase
MRHSWLDDKVTQRGRETKARKSMVTKSRVQAGDALVVVDVQKDFCREGTLEISHADEIVPVLNEWIDAASTAGARIVFSRDWHPADHVSFKEQGGPWPQHCVQGSDGARFHPQLHVPTAAQVVSKGTKHMKDSYSAFDSTGLAAELHSGDVQRIWIGGLAQDVCVRATALDARTAGFEVHLIAGATRPVDAQKGRQAIDEMRDAGVIIDKEGPYEPAAA